MLSQVSYVSSVTSNPLLDWLIETRQRKLSGFSLFACPHLSRLHVDIGIHIRQNIGAMCRIKDKI
jgi:hypothetical protein